MVLSFSMFKEYLMKQMIERQLKSLSEADRTKIMDVVTKNPDFFANLAKELETQVKNGKSQNDAAMAVAQKYQEDLKKILGNQ